MQFSVCVVARAQHAAEAVPARSQRCSDVRWDAVCEGESKRRGRPVLSVLYALKDISSEYILRPINGGWTKFELLSVTLG
ncbi:unnamed protein product [Leptosia nina]|uniref:Secreted protein n=1 Tax=Leptosia nina TaxID=320188 RepID=A0AAV1IUD6_9NEOP